MTTSPALPSPEALRSHFLLDPEVVFLNHGSFGACPLPVFEQYQGWQRELQRQPVEFLGRRFNDLLRAAREPMAAFLNTDPDDIVFVPNATTGLNVVARSLPLAPGDEVLTTNHEYGALDRTWRFVCRQRGARYINHPLPLPLDDPEAMVEELWAQVTPQTRVLFLSHITSPTGLTFPVAPLVQRARERGILTVVDGAHVPGQLPLDLAALDADFYSGNFHKWLCAPPGSAFLYARREHQPLLSPLVVSWGWEPEAEGRSPFIDQQEWQGTRDIAAFLATPAALDFRAAFPWEAIQARCHALVRTARAGVGALTGLPHLTSEDGGWFAQMAAMPLPLTPEDGLRLKSRLYDEYHIEIPVTVWQGRPLIRISVQGYNSEADVQRFLHALEVLLGEYSRHVS